MTIIIIIFFTQHQSEFCMFDPSFASHAQGRLKGTKGSVSILRDNWDPSWGLASKVGPDGVKKGSDVEVVHDIAAWLGDCQGHALAQPGEEAWDDQSNIKENSLLHIEPYTSG
eukprot:CAMPEP_0194558658 /NCGR_PEP_ID=MMETSP0292-20121207/492_1 /TAXON_ID=39354 /ORGANISM="Heterosigma akashiwo, Strain CCMP2393" /LENGTH=112 /DNA_ID=CAMNT_0039406365 /DNA_START=550 /DNA_END=889 /DNA_ORIENTATION=+